MQYAIGFLIFGLILIGIEFFLPGFGIPGISGIAFMAASVIIFSGRYGPVVATLAFIATAVVVFIAIKIFLKKNGYKKFVLENNSNDIVKDFNENEIKDLEGAEGVTIVPLKPYGKASFKGRIVDVFSEMGYIDIGNEVIVVEVRGKNVVVRKK
ncbi:MAG: NfeD family protein [Lachnospiraceae bacterium]|nr:NfeD family protein [Lachnospiraceae bacterium]